MENFEEWLMSHKLTKLYVSECGMREPFFLISKDIVGEYVFEFTREMKKFYDALTDINKNCMDMVDELITELESAESDIMIYKKIIRNLVSLEFNISIGA